jgi:protoporphyrinogen oxidase
MPLKELCEISGDDELLHDASQMSHSSTISFNIGVRGPLREDLRDIHWIYVPDRDIPFYRVGFYSNISGGACASGYHSLYVEVGVSPEQADREDLVRDLQPTILSWLEKLGWVTASDIVCIVTHILRYAYVHHTRNRDEVVNHAIRYLKESDVHPIGRYGLWDYISMEDSMESAKNTVMDSA